MSEADKTLEELGYKKIERVELDMIEIGDFIRTKQGEIAKIVDTNMFNNTIYKDEQGARYYLEDIVKHSKNIIDLIEVRRLCE